MIHKEMFFFDLERNFFAPIPLRWNYLFMHKKIFLMGQIYILIISIRYKIKDSLKIKFSLFFGYIFGLKIFMNCIIILFEKDVVISLKSVNLIQSAHNFDMEFFFF